MRSGRNREGEMVGRLEAGCSGWMHQYIFYKWMKDSKNGEYYFLKKYLNSNSDKRIKVLLGFKVIVPNIKDLTGRYQHEFTEEKLRKPSDICKLELTQDAGTEITMCDKQNVEYWTKKSISVKTEQSSKAEKNRKEWRWERIGNPKHW